MQILPGTPRKCDTQNCVTYDNETRIPRRCLWGAGAVNVTLNLNAYSLHLEKYNMVDIDHPLRLMLR